MNDSCVVCGKLAVHTHHRKLRSQGGDDERSNLLRVCFACHNDIHANPSESYARGLLVHSWADPAEVTLYGLGGIQPDYPESVTYEQLASVAEGAPCPTCKRRVPHKKKASTPSSKVWSTRLPLDESETFSEMVDAAAEHMDATSRPFHRYFTLVTGLALILQSPKEHLPNG